MQLQLRLWVGVRSCVVMWWCGDVVMWWCVVWWVNFKTQPCSVSEKNIDHEDPICSILVSFSNPVTRTGTEVWTGWIINLKPFYFNSNQFVKVDLNYFEPFPIESWLKLCWNVSDSVRNCWRYVARYVLEMDATMILNGHSSGRDC